MAVAMAVLSWTTDHTAAANDGDAAEGVLVAAGDTWAPTTTPPAMSLPTTDVMAAAADTDAGEGTLVLTGDSFMEATPVTPVATHAVSVQAPTTTPPTTSLWTNDDKAAANDRDAAEGMSVLTGDTCTIATPVTPVGAH